MLVFNSCSLCHYNQLMNVCQEHDLSERTSVLFMLLYLQHLAPWDLDPTPV